MSQGGVRGPRGCPGGPKAGPSESRKDPARVSGGVSEGAFAKKVFAAPPRNGGVPTTGRGGGWVRHKVWQGLGGRRRLELVESPHPKISKTIP